jgi:iron complex outermembrane receptor protein
MTETLYTYSYASVGLSLKGDASSATSSQVGSGFGVPSTDIAGRVSDDAYRTWGNIVRTEHAFGDGVFRAGLWLERSRQKYQRLAQDLTSGVDYNINKSAASPVLFDYTSSLQTVQPFAEYEWTASTDFTLRTGLRWQRVQRGFDASVVPNSLPGTAGEVKRSVGSTLPNVDARYALDSHTQAYVQWARGALVPNQSFFYTSAPAANNQAQPETSQAIQAGFTRAAGALNFTVDAYTIQLKNYFSSVTVSSPSGNTTAYVNNGNVRYRGIEFEGNARLGTGFTALANYSLIRAQFQSSAVPPSTSTYKAGDTIPLAPSYLGLLGVLYGDGPWSGSLITRFIGGEYQGKNGSSDGPSYHVPSYSYTNMTLARAFDGWLGLRHARLALQVDNVENRTAITDAAGLSVAGPALVNVLARRSVRLTLSCDL